MRNIKVAVIGAGFIGKAHIEAIRRLGDADVAAVCHSSREKAEAFARALNIPKAYGDYMRLLEDEDIEAVHNCTPNHLHYEINRQALLQGKHVLSEKPLTMTSEEAKSLCELARTKRLAAAVNFNYRQFPMVQQLRSMAKDGDFGAVRIVRGSYLQDWLLYETDYNWRLEPEFGGPTRAIGDIGSHLFDLAQYVTGFRIAEVLADASTVVPVRYKPTDGGGTSFRSTASERRAPVRVQTEDYCSVLVKFENGARGVFTVSQVSAGKKNALEIHLDGARASGCWQQEEPFRLRIGYRDRAAETLSRDPSLLKPAAQPFVHYPGGHEEGWTDAMKNMMRHFYDAVGGSAPLPDSVATFEDGYRVMLLNEAIVRSARSGAWEKVPAFENEAVGGSVL